MRIIILYSLITVYLFTACVSPVNESSHKPETGIKWFEGNFEFSTENGLYREFWKKKNDNEYIGKGYFLNKNDTSFLMRMRLFKEDETIKMDYNVRGQNSGKDVQFALTKHEKNMFVFENPFRGFPSIMQYKLLGDTAINIVERGFEDNKDKVQDFTIYRIKSD